MRRCRDFATIGAMLGNGGRFTGWRTRPGTQAAVQRFRVERERRAIGRFNETLARELQAGVPEDVLRALQVALDELLTNVILHAEQPAGAIDVEIRRANAALEATIRYRAVEFDPTAWQPAAEAATVAASRVGGHGIRLVRSLMDEFRYVNEAGVNVVTVCKRW